MSSRAKRGSRKVGGRGRITKSVTEGKQGFECDRVGEELVLTFYDTLTAVTIKVRVSDGREIARMMLTATGERIGEGTADLVVERESGLVIADRLPGS